MLHQEKAGQPKRGCLEHIVDLLLIINLFMKSMTPLFIAFMLKGLRMRYGNAFRLNKQVHGDTVSLWHNTHHGSH